MPFILQLLAEAADVDELSEDSINFNDFVTKSSYAVSPGLKDDETEKRLVGFKVKRLLDLGRVLFIN